MSSFDSEIYRELIQSARSTTSSLEHGRALEQLVAYLLGCVPGLKVIGTDVRTHAEELDVVAYNEQQDRAFRAWETVVFVECKNWSEPVGAAEIAVFQEKLRTRSLKFGLLVAREGVTGDADGYRDATLKIREAMSLGYRIVVLTLDDLEAVTGAEAFSELVLNRLSLLFLFRLK
jgi:Holliday junction resolvase-like predicted endonuclease